MIASGNQGKIREFQGLLRRSPECSAPARQPGHRGDRRHVCGQCPASSPRRLPATGEWALADDSGLSVMALDGAPGVHSARYAPTDPERIAKVLNALERFRTNARPASCAALCVAAPDGTVLLEVEGRCEGSITLEPRGNGGFGYDPIFEVTDTAAPSPRCPNEKSSTATADEPSACWNPTAPVAPRPEQTRGRVTGMRLNESCTVRPCR